MSDQWTIDRGLVERIAKVARLELTEDEIEKFTKQLKVILEAFRELDDVDTEGVADVAGYITPVPGGTGPMTNAMLMRNTLIAAQRQLEQA